MLGRLCRWLRCLGCDSAILPNHLPRGSVAAAATEASRSGRVFLTRCHGLINCRDAAAIFWLTSDSAEDQLQQLVEHFGIRFNRDSLMSRCSKCGSGLLMEASHEEAASQVAPHLLDVVKQFWRCHACGKVPTLAYPNAAPSPTHAPCTPNT